MGHGSFDPSSDEGLIALTDATGAPHFLHATELGRLLADHSSLRLVLLNSCEGGKGSAQDVFSSTAAILVRRGIPAVVAMQYAISDQAAMEFARAFYEALADGLSVDAAVTEARKAVSLAVANTVEWGTPLLYMRAPEGIIFQLPAARRSVLRSAPPPDREAALRWETLYTDGLSAFWAEEWDRAIRNFQAILDERPDYPNVAAKLEDARRQQKLGSLYDQAVAAQEAGDWAPAESALQILAAEAADYKDVSARLVSTRKQRQLADLQDQAHKLFAAEQWPAVVKVFGQIAALDPDFKDPNGLLSTAQERVAELKRRAELDRLYGRAVAELDAGRWTEARQLLRQVQDQSPGLRDTERLLARAEAELARQAAEQRRQAQIVALYDQARDLARDRKWQQALTKTDEIRKLDAGFADPQGIGERAQRELAAEAAEAQRQSELAALYSEAVQLLQTQQYQGALEKWSQVQALDPRFQDRQKVQATALKKLNELAKASAPRPSVSGRGGAAQSRSAIEAAPAAPGRIALSRRTIFIALGAMALIIVAVLGILQLVGGGKSGPPPPGSATIEAPTAISSAVAIAPSTATSTAESVVTPAQPTVVATPAPAQRTATATATPDPFLYDSFDNPAYDGWVDVTRWLIGEGCQPFAQGEFQRNGMLEMKSTLMSQEFACRLYTHDGVVPGAALGAFEAQMKLASDHTGGRATNQLLVTSVLGNQRSWNITCGQSVDEDGAAHLDFSVSSMQGADLQRYYERSRDVVMYRWGWHIVQLKFDPETMAVSCLVDGEEIGTYAPANADELRAATFARVVETERTQGAAATTFIDDVRLLPPETPKPKAASNSTPVAGCLPPPPGMVAWWPGDGYAGRPAGRARWYT